jgi:hypothetical protein
MTRSTPAVDPTLGRAPPLPSTAAGGDAADPSASVMFSPAFALDGGRNIAFELSAGVSNNWLYAVIDLINDDTGGVVSFDTSIEYYAGTDSDGAWREGETTAREVIGPVPAGNYLLRVEGQHGGTGGVELTVVVRQGVFRARWFLLCLGVLAAGFAIAGLHASSVHRRRWRNSNLGAARASPSGGDDDDDDD